MNEPISMPIRPTAPEPVRTCGQCKHGIAVSLDLQQPLECREGPPTVYAFPTPDGQIALQTAYPRPPRSFIACHRFAPKLAGLS